MELGETKMSDVDLMVPTIHMNGTSKESLLEGICEAVNKLHDAGRALAAACPNGRDYYTQGPGAISVALDQHEARMKKLREIIGELEQIAEAL
jgi:hypothetical protein